MLARRLPVLQTAFFDPVRCCIVCDTVFRESWSVREAGYGVDGTVHAGSKQEGAGRLVSGVALRDKEWFLPGGEFDG
ncbi:hypothetical protein HOY80DRAFT_990169 [Tuber brumale]|nr:hypothetical protein HOY80DRAFT_990169 [Tuber brumale]